MSLIATFAASVGACSLLITRTEPDKIYRATLYVFFVLGLWILKACVSAIWAMWRKP